AVVIGSAQLLQRETRDPAIAKRVEPLVEAGERCARIVRSFLALAREQPMQRARTGVNGVITETIEMLAYGMQEEGVETVLDLAGDVPDVWADAQQIRQILVNLVSNAQYAVVQVTPPRRVTVRTR